MSTKSANNPNVSTRKRGAFINGIWLCDCDPREPADKFQTKKGGKNHGRWFYTCQKPQHKRCSFFLWTDDAKVREESAILSNSRSEPLPPPQTPNKGLTAAPPPTPDTRPRHTPVKQLPPPTPTKHRAEPIQKDNEFDWSSSADEDLVEAVKLYDTPRKAARTALITSPGKTTRSNISTRPTTSNSTLPNDDVFITPSTSKPSYTSGLLSPTRTPSYLVPNLPSREDPDSSLSSQALDILSPLTIPSTIESQLVSLLEKHELRTSGIAKGREITRLAVQAKDRQISDLQARIQTLEAERETSRSVISHLKHDMASGSSPKKGRRRSEGVERGERDERVRVR